MNQQCKVCGEPAAGFHFGAFTCEGCKSFFGRTYNNLSSISECKNNGECVINKKNRTACKACRLRKCLVVGMSKSGSRYGRRSNWFKIHCLLQEQQAQKNGGSNNNNNNNTLASNNNDTGSGNNNNGSNSPGLLPNGFLPANFLSNLCNNNNNNNVPLKKELKRPSSPSDSGASSADPDESGNPFAASINTRTSTISPKVEVPEVTLTKISPKTSRTPSTSSSSTTATSDTFRPLLDRMSPYQLPPTFRPDPAPYFPIPFAIPPVSLALLTNSGKHHHHQLATNEQREPIDLSMKSKSSSSSGSPNRLGSPLLPSDVTGGGAAGADGDDGEDLSSAAESAPRPPVPLDLTFVRAKALSG